MAEGAIYAILGWQTSKRSQVALGLGIALFALDTILLVVGSASGHNPPTGGLIARIFFFVPLVKGFGALRELRAAARPAPSSTAAL